MLAVSAVMSAKEISLGTLTRLGFFLSPSSAKPSCK